MRWLDDGLAYREGEKEEGREGEVPRRRARPE
jgi:hypothetical protein